MKKNLHDVEIISSAAGTSGLRLTNLPSWTAQSTFNGILGINASGDVIKIDATKVATVTVAAVAPATPALGQQWLDTSVTPSELKIWNGTAWELANDEVQHYANFAAFPPVGDEDVLYIDDNTDTAYVRDSTTSTYKNASGGANGLFSITDGTTTESVGLGNTITFTENANIADVLDLVVSATDTVTLQAKAGATTGQTLVWNGTKFVYANATADRYVNAYTPTANVATTHTHGLATIRPIVQVYDTASGELIGAEVIRLSGTQFNVIVTTADPITVIWI